MKDEDGKVTDVITAKNIIIATGARPRQIPGIEVDREYVLTSTRGHAAAESPEEKWSSWALVPSALNSPTSTMPSGPEVTIIEMQDRLLPVEDEEVSKELRKVFERELKMNIMTTTKVLSAKKKGKGVEIQVEKKDGTKEVIKADLALNAIGVQGNIENIGLEAAGVKLERGWIVTDEFMRTNIPSVYAIGDVAGAPGWLTKPQLKGS